MKGLLFSLERKTMYQLIIAEKPSVAQTIAATLGVKQKKNGYIEGNGYLVSWCVGHLVGLAEAAAYGEQYRKWSYDSLPILPQEWKYSVADDKGKQFKALKELMHRADVSEVVNACDAGSVQTPTLKMLVGRDAAISTFKKEKYYHVRLMLSGAEAASSQIRAAEEATALKNACEAA